ncbi:unnamed protein product [Ectocarpus sp. 6 AP-2014]
MYTVGSGMERLNPHLSLSYWKVGAAIVFFVAATSSLSSKCYENQTMPRKHVLKLVDMLRSAGEYSIRASQSTNAVAIYADTCSARNAVNTVADLLTPQQVKTLTGVNLCEIKEFISQQHQNATEVLLQALVDKKKFKPAD